MNVRKRGVCAITDVELTTKEWKRVLGWYTWLGKKSKPIEADENLKKKIEIIYEAEKAFEDSITEDD